MREHLPGRDHDYKDPQLAAQHGFLESFGALGAPAHVNLGDWSCAMELRHGT